jgi:hypothetical protein
MLPQINIHLSRWFILVVIICYVGAVISLNIISWNVFWKIPCTLLSLYCFKRYLYRYALLRHPQSVVAFGKQNMDEWYLKTRQGELILAKLKASSVLTSYFVLLNFYAVDNRKFSLILFKDSLDTQNFRRLSAYLRHFNEISISDP